MDNVYAVIMAGGKGERFWPLSTSEHPKQVLSLVGDKPMLAMTVDYVRELIPPERILIITNAGLADVTRRAVPELPAENVIGEPFGRDTAAACALGAALVGARAPDGAFCILTADHVIDRLDVFRRTLADGLGYALAHDVLMTIGIPPAFPSTGFGYIETGGPVEAPGATAFLEANRFVEKPDRATARTYVDAGNYFWNSGMFMWSVASFRRALERFQPALLGMTDRMQVAAWTAEFNDRIAAEYGNLGKISVDYAIMEHADNIVMARCDFTWDDIGSWPALANHFPPDTSGNVLLGECETLASHDNIVISGERLTALIGVRDLVVVQAGKATLICPKDRAQDVKQMVQHLREQGGYEDVL